MNENCPKCQGTGIVKDENGAHTCWDCLSNGDLDAHSESLPETSIKKLMCK